MNALAPTDQKIQASTALTVANTSQYVTLRIGDQGFGIPVMDIEDIIGKLPVTRVPLAHTVILGSMNLRGRIVTAVDMRRRLGMPNAGPDDDRMNVVVENKGDLYSLVVDSVGDVIDVPQAAIDVHPPTMSQMLREVSDGIHRLDKDLLVMLRVDDVLTF